MQPIKHLSVSVIIPTHNRAHLVTKAVDNALSLITPAYGDKIIVADDASTDNTTETLRPYGDRIIYLRLPENKGVSAARNLALKVADTDLVVFLDDDDEWMDNKFSIQRTLFEHNPDLLFCFTNFSARRRDNSIIENCLALWGQNMDTWKAILDTPVKFSELAPLPDNHPDFLVYQGDFYQIELEHDYVLPTTLVIRRQPALDNNAYYFDESIRYMEGLDLVARLLKVGKCMYLDCHTGWQHGHDGFRILNLDRITKSAFKVQIIENHWGQDEAFKRTHPQLVENRLDREFRILLNEYIRAGNYADARHILDRFHSAPPTTKKLLLRLPNSLVRLLVTIRALPQKIKQLIKRWVKGSPSTR